MTKQHILIINKNKIKWEIAKVEKILKKTITSILMIINKFLNFLWFRQMRKWKKSITKAVLNWTSKMRRKTLLTLEGTIYQDTKSLFPNSRNWRVIQESLRIHNFQAQAILCWWKASRNININGIIWFGKGPLISLAGSTSCLWNQWKRLSTRTQWNSSRAEWEGRRWKGSSQMTLSKDNWGIAIS